MENLNREQFSSRVRQYIVHKKVLAKFSDHYDKAEVAKSMRSVYDLAKMVSRNCIDYNMAKICYMVRLNEQHLRNILPRPEHVHYKRQLEKLEVLLTIAKNYKPQ